MHRDAADESDRERSRAETDTAARVTAVSGGNEYWAMKRPDARKQTTGSVVRILPRREFRFGGSDAWNADR